jgi:hypothetical protein
MAGLAAGSTRSRMTHFGRCLVSKLGDKQSAWLFPFNVGHHEQFFSTLPGVCF